MSAQLKMLQIPDRLDYHEMLIERFVKCLLNIALGALNMMTFCHLTSHESAPSRLEQEQPSRDRNRSKIKNRTQEPFAPKKMPKGSEHPAPSRSCPRRAPMTLAAKNQSHHCLPNTSSLADFSGLASLLGFSSFSFTTSYLVFLLPVSD